MQPDREYGTVHFANRVERRLFNLMTRREEPDKLSDILTVGGDVLADISFLKDRAISDRDASRNH